METNDNRSTNCYCANLHVIARFLFRITHISSQSTIFTGGGYDFGDVQLSAVFVGSDVMFLTSLQGFLCFSMTTQDRLPEQLR